MICKKCKNCNYCECYDIYDESNNDYSDFHLKNQKQFAEYIGTMKVMARSDPSDLVTGLMDMDQVVAIAGYGYH